MKAYRLTGTGGFDRLEMRDEAVPRPGRHEVLVRVRATSINYRDLAIASGTYGGGSVGAGVIPLSDGAGEIVELGEGVKGFSVGDRVAAIFRQNWQGGRMPVRALSGDLGGSRDGMLADYRALSEEGIVRVPDHLSFAEAACLPCAGITAWHALTAGERVAPGQSVLTLGSGGVSLFALQFAAALGARVVATTSSEAKAETLRGLGAEAVVNHRARADWDAAVLELTGGAGVDRVVETVGPSTLERSIRACAVGGRVVLVGAMEFGARIDPGPILFKRITVQGITTGSREMFEDMNRAIAHWRLRPLIARSFGFDEARAAYAYAAAAGAVGKIVIEAP